MVSPKSDGRENARSGAIFYYISTGIASSKS
jgi:hypothetical protein